MGAVSLPPIAVPASGRVPADRTILERIVHIAPAVRHDDRSNGPRADSGCAAPESPFRPARWPEERPHGSARSRPDVSLGNGLARGIDACLVSEVRVVEPFRVRELEVVDVRPHDGGHLPATLVGGEPALKEKTTDSPHGVEAVHIAAGEE